MRPRPPARYAPLVLRAADRSRYALLVLSFALSSACGASTVAVVRPRAEPLPVSDNQQGHSEVLGIVEDSTPMSEDVPLAEEPSIGGVYLWCQTPGGPACRLASAALGTGPKDPTGLPPSLLSVEDLENDCSEPTIAEIEHRLTRAFAVQDTGWRDQTGSYLDSSLLSDMYSAAGCINDADASRPIAKISAGSTSAPRTYLVRVWDSGGGTVY